MTTIIAARFETEADAERAFERFRVPFGIRLVGRGELVQLLAGCAPSACARRRGEVLLQKGRVDSAKEFQMLDANKLLAHELDGDLLLGDETISRDHQRSDEHDA